MTHFYKIKLRDHLRQFQFFIGIIILSLFAIYFLVIYRGDQIDTSVILIITISIVFIFFAPSFILHTQYFLKNRKCEISINEETGEIKYFDNREKKAIKFTEQDIIKIIEYKTKEKAINESSFFPWYNYSYAKIVLKNGFELYITSLLIKNLESIFNQKNIEVNISFYNWIRN